MGHPAYEARRSAEKAEAEERELQARAGQLMFDCIVDFLSGRSRLIVEPTGDGFQSIRFQR